MGQGQAARQAPVVELVPPPAVDGAARGKAEEYRSAVRAFSEIAGALNDDGHDQQDLLRLIARHVCGLTGIGRCSIYLYDPKSGLFRGQVGFGKVDSVARQQDELRIQRLVCGVEADRFTQEIVATRRPVVVADTTNDPRPVRSAMRSWGVRSMLGVPMVTGDDVVGIIYLDDGEDARRFTDEECELAAAFAEMAAVVIGQAEMARKMRQSLRTVAHQNELLRKASAMDDRLTELVLSGGSLGQIAAATADLTGKPVDIYDQDGRRLARSVPEGLDETAIPPLLDPRFRSAPAVRDALDALGARGGGVVGPIPEAGLRHRCVVAPITTRDDLWGALVVVEQGSPFAPLDRHIARRAATNAALELSAERRAASAEWDARAALASDLIRGSGEAGSIARRAEYLGVDLDAPHLLCLVTAGESQERALTVAALGAALGQGTGDGQAVLATAVDEGVLAVVPLARDVARLDGVARTRARVAAVLDRLAPGARLDAALSTVCVGVRAFPGAFAEARQVLGCAQRLVDGDQSVVLAADDLGAGRLLIGATSRDDADRFVADTLGPLLVEGDQQLADLRETLRVFLAEQRSVRRAARVLDVHENTVRYRLTRIEEMTHLAVGSDSDQQLTAQIALTIVRLRSLGRRPAALAASTTPG
jgi:sugar diacid utilization regulator